MVNEKNGMEHPSIDHNYPVLVVASFAKNQYYCLKIEADAIAGAESGAGNVHAWHRRTGTGGF